MENSNFTTDQSSSQVLPAGYELDEYVIEQEIGAGGFGITYKAYDKQLDRYVAIKEYFPFNLASRDEGMQVSPKTRVAAVQMAGRVTDLAFSLNQLNS